MRGAWATDCVNEPTLGATLPKEGKTFFALVSTTENNAREPFIGSRTQRYRPSPSVARDFSGKVRHLGENDNRFTYTI